MTAPRTTLAIPEDRRYSPDHVWLDDVGRVGVTPHLLAALRGVERVHLPLPGTRIEAAIACGALEGGKGILDVYAPCDGTVRLVNEALLRRPELLDEDPYGAGWLFEADVRRTPLLSAAEYAEHVRRGTRLALRSASDR